MRIRDPTHLYDGDVSPGAGRVARAVSVITHAPFLSAMMFVLLGLTADDAAIAIVSIVVALVTATVVPVAAVQHYSVKYGNKDGDVVRGEDRARPLLFGVASYIVGSVLLWSVDAPRIMTVMMVSYAVSTAAVAIISTRWKISIHAMGVIGPAMALSLAYWPWGLAMFLLLPPVAWSRYIRGKHTPAQLVGGAVFGLLSTGAVLWPLM